MDYPERLLPVATYHKIRFTAAHNSCWLVRHTSDRDIWDEFGGLKHDAVTPQTDHLRDFSTNILGEYQPDDVYFHIIKPSQPSLVYDSLMAEWEEGNVVAVPEWPQDFGYDAGRGRYFLNVGRFHEKEFLTYDDSTGVKPVCKVLHTPINANFWHCSLRWFYNGIDTMGWDKGPEKKQRRRILETAKSYIKEQAEREEPTYEAVAPTDYQ